MESLIDKLASQCWSHRINGTLIDGHLHFDYNKFAELIVAECLDIVEDEDDGSVDTKSIRWAMIRIKKHFGVEE